MLLWHWYEAIDYPRPRSPVATAPPPPMSHRVYLLPNICEQPGRAPDQHCITCINNVLELNVLPERSWPSRCSSRSRLELQLLRHNLCCSAPPESFLSRCDRF